MRDAADWVVFLGIALLAAMLLGVSLFASWAFAPAVLLIVLAAGTVFHEGDSRDEQAAPSPGSSATTPT